MRPNIRHLGRRRSLWTGPAFITALILLIPLLRNLFVYGWDWDLRGFLFVGSVGTLLFGAGLTYQMITKKLATPAYRAAVGVALVTAFHVTRVVLLLTCTCPLFAWLRRRGRGA